MVWSYWIHDAITGARVGRVRPALGSWTRRLGATGNGSHTFQLRDRALGVTATERREWARAMFVPDAHKLCVAWDDTLMYSGILGKPDYDKSTGTLTLPHSELRAARWGIRSVGTDTINARSLSGAVRAALGRAVVGGGNRALPLDGPPDGAGTFTRIISAFEAMTVEDLISLIESQGVEIDHPPYFTAGYAARWATTVAAKITGQTIDLPVSVPRAAVIGPRIVEDIAKMVTRVDAIGNGTESRMLTASATTASARPARERVLVLKDIIDQTQLQQAANVELARNENPVEQWSLSVQISEDITPPDLVPGTICPMDIRGDDWKPDGSYNMRVIALRADTTTTLQPEVQPL